MKLEGEASLSSSVMATSGGISPRLLCKPEGIATSCRPVVCLGSHCYSSRFDRTYPTTATTLAAPSCCVLALPSSSVRRVINTNEHSFVESSPGNFPWGFGNLQGRVGVSHSYSFKGNNSRYFVRMALFSWVPEPSPASEVDFDDSPIMEVIESVGELNSIADFTRFRDNGEQGAELQTAIITYKKRFPWSLFQRQQVQDKTTLFLI